MKSLHIINEAALRGAADVAKLPMGLLHEDGCFRAEISVGSREVVISRYTEENFVSAVLEFLRSITRNQS